MLQMILSALLIVGIIGTADAQDKITLGRTEKVLLLPWGVKLPARIDSGAGVCSLDARELQIDKDMAEFNLPNAYGGLRLRLPVIRWRTVHSANGRKRRPVVQIEIRLGPKRLRVEANLEDRSKVKYPLLIGRNALRHGFVVDASKANLAPPENRGVRAP